MAAEFTWTGLDGLHAKLARTASRTGLQAQLVDNLHRAATPIFNDMHAATFTRIQKRAVASVRVAHTSVGIELTGGSAGDSLDRALFNGGEYGGRKPKKVFARTSLWGRPVTRVYRRTTMQFLPHLGRDGYFFWPTVRDWMPKLAKQSEEIVQKALAD